MPSRAFATPCTNFSVLYSANVTAGSITAPVPTTTEPSGNGVFDNRFSRDRRSAMNYVVVAFFGAGADNATGTARVTGWRKVSSLWVPVPLLALNFTLGTST